MSDTSFYKPKDRVTGLVIGNITLVQLWSKVPWLYLEAGADSSKNGHESGGITDAQKQIYAKGIIDGVVASVPPGSGGTTSGTCDSSSTGSGNAAAIVEYAMKYAWDELYGKVNGCTPKPAYIEPYEKLYSYTGRCGAKDYSPCDQFAGTVMITSGADKDFEKSFATYQSNYMESHTEKYTKISTPKSTREVLSGDIFVTNPGIPGDKKNHGHIMIYVGDQPSNKPDGDIRNGSKDKYAPSAASTGYYFGAGIDAYRLK